MSENRELLRHTVATVAYRAARALEGADEGFARFSQTGGRAPGALLAHMGDLFDWALSMAKGAPEWHNSEPLAWAAEKDRFFAALASFDAYLASPEPMHAPADRLFQGPIADALTHVGQLALMRRLYGAPTVGENFYMADVKAGKLDADQGEPVQPFRKR
ncbi:MAG TPA: hypothetical protein VG893_13855 [Terracidiphilus sp.]|nr:hypothetical protein [Terracidiphilus sp.]